MTATTLVARHCSACEKESPLLTPRQASDLLKQLHGWASTGEGKRICLGSEFKWNRGG
jgi:hypothetical protein